MNRQVHVYGSGDSTIISVDDAITLTLPCSLRMLEDAVVRERSRLVVSETVGMTVSAAQHYYIR